jgi:hypothetical protein
MSPRGSAYHQKVRGSVVVTVLVFALAAASAAVASRGDPQRQITAADQSRAKAIVVRKSDLAPGFAPSLQSGLGHGYCAADDESDLVVTGEARSGFALTPVAVASGAEIYKTVANSSTSWRRSTGVGGRRCLVRELRRELVSVGVSDVRASSPFSFPRLAQHAFALRVAGFAQGVPVYFDVLALQQARAQVVLLFASAATPVPRAEQIRIARAVAGRMTKAMRGA